MSSAIFSLPELYASYKSWVSKNPQTASDFETTAKWVSYFIAGRINNSHVLSELVYSLSNLLVLFNDRIIQRAQQNQPQSASDNMKVWLTVLEYSEVFYELSAEKLWGVKGRWFIVVCLQTLKCVLRLFLVFHHKVSMVENPPIPVLKRNGISAFNETDRLERIDSLSFTLQHSGRIIRKVDSSPPVAFRTWKPLEQAACDNNQSIQQSLIDKQLIAETLYILKPIIHLGSVACFGNNTWKPWVLSLFVDLYSLRLYKQCQKVDYNSLSKQQQLQISRRTVVLLLYLLRSPFYEQHSKERIETLLKGISNKIPLAKLISNPILQYLPFWQGTYFYMWST